MASESRAGTPATAADLVDVEKLLAAYHDGHPDPADAAQAVAFGTSGHRGSSLSTTFNDDHIAATTQAIVEYRTREGTDGPLFVGADTHALSEPAWETCVEVLTANGVTVLVDADGGYTPTPAVSHAILAHNHSRAAGIADGIVITPSHNPPQDGGFKYNPPNGGPADTDATKWIAGRANELLAAKLDGVRRQSSPPRVTRWRSTTSWAPTSTTCPPWSTSPRSAAPASGSARTRWAVPASRTGAPSPSGTAST
jgi:phosphoglucomutase